MTDNVWMIEILEDLHLGEDVPFLSLDCLFRDDLHRDESFGCTGRGSVLPGALDHLAERALPELL